MTEEILATFRVFRQTDLDEITQLIHRSISFNYSKVYPPRTVEFFKAFHTKNTVMARSKDGENFVVEENGKVVGTGSIDKNNIYAVFVDPEAQGKGHGRLILESLEGLAKEKGYDEVTIDISKPSQEFYTNLGYIVGNQSAIDIGDGEKLDFWKAHKPING